MSAPRLMRFRVRPKAPPRSMNFGAGPAAIPRPVLEEVQAELLDYQGTGMSILEMSHRSKEYSAIHDEAMALTRELLGLGDDFEILLLGGGATAQFAMLPMNLRASGGTGNYVLTGSWSVKAHRIAAGIAPAHVAATTECPETKTFARIPKPDELAITADASYLHLTSNNTIFGTQWQALPDVDAPLVVDMSSDILSRSVDGSRCAMIYAGAQKNLGPAGVTLVAIRKDFLQRCDETLPEPFNYKHQAAKKSLSNTPPCFAIYIVGKTLKWIRNEGGPVEMERRNREKAGLLYRTIEEHADFYRAPVAPDSRSAMNVVFRLPTPELEQRFLAEAQAERMTGLKGHRSVGGIRVSIYNGVPREWVDVVMSFMREFARRNA